MKQILYRLFEHQYLGREEARNILQNIAEGRYNDSQIASLITVQLDEVTDGQAAVDRIAASPEGYYNLVLMDIQMPRLNGYEATRQIRKLNRRDSKTLPIVAMTANAFEEDVRLAMQAGMNAHFAKPIDMDRLAEILRRFLSNENSDENLPE